MARLIATGLATILLVACADPGPATDTTEAGWESTVTTTSSTSPVPETAAAATTSPADAAGTTTGKGGSVSDHLDPALSDDLELARQDLAGRLGISIDEIEVLSAESVGWPDSSLGCPQPGMAYLQVLTDGYRIILEAGGTQYAYHGATAEPPFYCEQPS